MYVLITDLGEQVDDVDSKRGWVVPLVPAIPWMSESEQIITFKNEVQKTKEKKLPDVAASSFDDVDSKRGWVVRLVPEIPWMSEREEIYLIRKMK